MDDEKKIDGTEDELLKRRAERWVAEKAWLFHERTGVCSRAAEFYDGVEKRFVHDGKEIAGPVMVVESGDSFHLKADSFTRLESKEIRFYSTITAVLSHVLGEIARSGASLGIPESTGVKITSSLFVLQGKALLAAFARKQASEPANDAGNRIVLFQSEDT